MKKILITIVLGAFFLIHCTNPEVNFPEEQKKTDENKTAAVVYNIPTVLVYPEDTSPFLYFQFFSLAYANGAKETLFLPSLDRDENIISAVERLKKTTGEKPVIIIKALKSKELFDSLKKNIQKIIVFEPFQETLEEEEKDLVVLVSGEAPKTEEKKPENEVKPENTETNESTQQETQTEETKTQQEEIQTETVEKEETVTTDETLKKESTETVEKTDSEEKKIEEQPLAKPVHLIEKMKNTQVLNNLLEAVIGKKQTVSLPEEEKLIYIKGKSFSKAVLSIMEIKEEGGEPKKTFSVASGKAGFFSSLIVDPKKEFFLTASYGKEKTWNFYFAGLIHSYPFCEIIPDPKSLAEIISIFSPIDFNLIKLPPEVIIPEEMKEKLKNLYFLKIVKTEKDFSFDFSEKGLWIGIPDENILSIGFKIGTKEIQIQKNTSLYILN